jgi:hypothetical protein
MSFFLSPHLRVATIPGKGRGVIATAAIAAGTEVECSPLLACPEGIIPEHGHPLSDFVFAHGKGTAIGLGYSSLYNHSNNPTCTWLIEEAPPAVRITAARDILAGEELTIDYVIPLWFREA